MMSGSAGSKKLEPADLRKQVSVVPRYRAPNPPTGVSPGSGIGGRKAKARGTAFERRCRKILEAAGYQAVRSAGSHGPADLIAMRQGETAFIQCQMWDHVSTAEWNEFRRLALAAGVTPVWVFAKSKKGEPFKEPLWWVATGDKDGHWMTGAYVREPWRFGR